ncbi:ABC transporter permease [Ktedonobacteria bacterium brp13]|nr:ABC transporter permease [Ktedonobacteria bacterium brp13]
MYGDVLTNLLMIFHYHFMQNAYVAGTLVAITAGIMGYFMVLRGQSFAGHSLANVGFAGATGSLLFGISPVVGLFIAGLCAALGIHLLNMNDRESHRSDIAVGAVLSASIALGYLFIHLATSEYGANVYNVLFGNILGIDDSDVTIIIWSTIILMLVLVVIGRPLFFASVDPEVAIAHRVPVRALALTYLVLLGLEVAVAVQIVGVLLIFSLLVTPAAIAQQLTTRPFVAIFIAAGLSLLFVWIGLAVGYITPYPVSFFITTFAFGTYVIVRGAVAVRRMVESRRSRSSSRQPLGGAA